MESLTLYLAQRVLGLDELPPERADQAVPKGDSPLDPIVASQALEELSADGLMSLISAEYQAYQEQS